MIQVQTLFDDGDQHVSGDGSPYLRLDCVFGDAKERFDAQVPFDPLEKQFDLPAATVKLGDGQRRQLEVVGQEDQIPVVLGIVELDTAQVLRVALVGFDAGAFILCTQQ